MSGIAPNPSLKALSYVSTICFELYFRPNKISVSTNSCKFSLNTNDFFSLILSQINPKVKIYTSLISGSSLLMLELIFSMIPSHSFLGNFNAADSHNDVSSSSSDFTIMIDHYWEKRGFDRWLGRWLEVVPKIDFRLGLEFKRKRYFDSNRHGNDTAGVLPEIWGKQFVFVDVVCLNEEVLSFSQRNWMIWFSARTSFCWLTLR